MCIKNEIFHQKRISNQTKKNVWYDQKIKSKDSNTNKIQIMNYRIVNFIIYNIIKKAKTAM